MELDWILIWIDKYSNFAFYLTHLIVFVLTIFIPIHLSFYQSPVVKINIYVKKRELLLIL